MLIVEEENNYLKEKINFFKEDKMILELHVADVVNDHKIKMDAMRLKIKILENMPFTPRLGIIMPLDQLVPWLRL